MKEKINLDESTMQLTLIRQDSVPTPSGAVKVCDLEEGDIVCMKDGQLSVNVAITNIVTNKGKVTLTFERRN